MVGVLYDVHANLPALEAVLADAREQGATRWILGGDYTSFGAWPAETLALLDSLEKATWIRGNWDRWAGGERDDAPDMEPIRGAMAYCETVEPERLHALPESHREGGTLFCHASPISDMLSFVAGSQELDERLLAGVKASRVVFGHTHLQFRRSSADGIELVNPGSVGLPLDGDTRAAYALLTPDGDIALRRVEYDVTVSAAGLGAIDADWAEEIARRLVSAGV